MQAKLLTLMFVNKNLALIEKHKNAFDKFLTYRSFAYFVFVPTYCYQLVFPKTGKINVLWVIQKSVKLAILSLVSLFIFLQYTYPLITESPMHFAKPISFLRIYPYVC